MSGWVYIVASDRNGTLYIGVTSNLAERIYAHKTGREHGFTRCYNVKRLVWYEQYDTMPDAIRVEKLMKKWPRAWKVNSIEARNPQWLDLYEQLNQ